MTVRVLQPELLDSLPPANAHAQQSRRDLARINAVMGNIRWFQRVLPKLVDPWERILELGAGDGALGRVLAPLEVDGIDRWPRPPHWPRRASWHQQDIFNFHEWHRYRVVIGNMIFHHFDDRALDDLGAVLRGHVRVIAACEPLRGRATRWAFLVLCRLIGADKITRHDGLVSIDAGFRQQELPQRLRLDPRFWRWSTTVTARGAYRMVAQRRA